MPEVGKISGQMLEDNLERSGIDLSFDNDLLYLDVTNRRIGAKSTTPYSDFLVNNTLKTDNLIVDTQFNVADFTFYGNTIQNVTGAINLDSFQNIVYAKGWRTSAGLLLTSNDIKATATNQSINFYPTGTGKTIFDKNVLVNGSLHATGDITFDGSLTFGDSDTDSVNIKADIASDIRPDITEFYSLGSLSPSAKRWNNTWANDTIIDSYSSSGSLVANNVDLTLRQGKTWYVATNGNDTNVGNHESGPYASLTKALSMASSGDTILINPGTYIETCPMTVPVGVTIKGLDIRTVLVAPTVATRNKDIFLLNGETTIEDLTVTGFEYDAVNNTGHAFRFKTGMTVTSRSPYIKNVSVITQGSTVRLATAPSDDPRGYLAGDAGRGAYIDGAVVSSTSKEASMLFHSCTFICPGARTIYMTNGVRVEWLNCFTYFAETGLYALNGTQGFAGLATKFGAEVRSINSASIYGRFGAWADGANTLMYLIGHNFAYVGAGRFSNNDPTLVIDTNEAVMDNSGKIYYQSTDQSGNMRVGSVFKINGETGAVSFVSNSLTLGGTSSITFENGPNRTYIDPTEVTTGNIRFSGNTISSLADNIIFSPLSGKLIFQANNLTIPKGPDSEITLSTIGEVDFNTSVNAFEGFGTNGRLNLYGIGDSTRTTRLVAESNPGANDQIIKAWANNDLKFTADTTKVFFKSLDLGGLSFNKYSAYSGRLTLNGNTDITVVPSNDITNIKNLEFTTDSITNTTLDNLLTLNSTNTGYWKVTGGAIVIPFGDNASRPAVLEVGMQRYNTQQGYLEAWDGTAWVNASGSTNVTITDMEEISDFWALVVG
jgi:hypothetical protein